MSKEFLGRNAELSVLQKKYDQNGFKMVVLYGRRRIGKTTLINEFIKRQKCRYISFVSVERDEKELLDMMTETVLTALAPELLGSVIFNDFEKIFEFIGNAAHDERVIFFIDEYPYLAKQSKKVQSILQKIIDYNWKQSNVFFIICGSLVGFMKDEVLGESAPLHGRCDLEIKLKAFNYLETAEFLTGYSCEEKAIIYGLTNGVAKYIQQFDVDKSLDDNIVEQYYSMGGFFSEEQVKTVVTGERQNSALYNSIISAIATGHTKNSEIASCVGMGEVTYPLKVLTKSELIERRTSSKPYYVLNDSMLEFWFLYVSRALSLINAGRGEVYYYSNVKEKLHDYMGKVFEKIAKEYVFMHAGLDGFPIVTEVENYQNSVMDYRKNIKQVEIDLIGLNEKDIVLAGECKFKNSKLDKEEYEEFLDKVAYLPARNVTKCLFSLGGFSEYVKKHSDDVILLTLEDMYKV